MPKTNSRFKPLRRSISLEEIFSTRRYLEDGDDDKWNNMVQAKFLTRKVLSGNEGTSSADSSTIQDWPSDAPNNTLDLTAISEESHSQENKTSDSAGMIRGVINEAMEKACALVEYKPNTFIETITKMAYSSESAAVAMQPNEGSITTSFHSLRLERTPTREGDAPVGKVMGRDERDCRKKEFIELWENHVDSLLAQEQDVSREYEAQLLDTTDALLAQEKSLQKHLHRISQNLDARKKLFLSNRAQRGDDLNEHEKLLLDKLDDYDLSKDENSIFYRIEQSILNKDRPMTRCTSVESTGTQTTASISTSTPNHSTFGESSDNGNSHTSKSCPEKSRIPIPSPRPRVLFEKNNNNNMTPKKYGGTKPKVVLKPSKLQVSSNTDNRVRSNASAIFSCYSPTPLAKENVNVFQTKEYPSPCLWLTIPNKGQKRVAQSPITPKTAKKPSKCVNVTLRKKVVTVNRGPISGRDSASLHENRVNTFRDMDLETDKLRGTIDRCTGVISDIGQSVHEMKVSLAEVATTLTDEIKALSTSR